MHHGLTMSRRGFLSAAAVATAGAVGAQAAGAAYPPGKYVDIHTHLGEGWGTKVSLSAEDLLRWMDGHDVAQAVVLPLISPEAWDHPITTGFVLKQTAPHRDRLLPFCSIDPRTPNLGSYEAKRDLLLRYRDAGARGFGEHKPGVAIDDPRNLELFKACAEVGFPVLVHIDNVRNTDKPGLPGLERVLTEVPDGVFIGHAQGWWASISGDVMQDQLQRYPSGPVTPGGALDRLFAKYPNLYGDLSAGSGANAIARNPEFGRAFLIRWADRLLFGTDYLAPDQEVPQFELFDSFALPPDVEEQIFRANARRILNV